MDFPGGPLVENPPANAGYTGSSLVWEDSICQGAAGHMHHKYRAQALQLLKPSYLHEEKPMR